MSDDPYAPFEALLASEPDDTMLLYGLGRKMLDGGHHERAAVHLRHCVEVDPGYSAAWRELGRALEAGGDTDGARTAYTRAIEVAQEKGDLQVVKEAKVFLGGLDG
ncbi:tetratricopeptide repeat protein [Engelhardtia mirabilis]|uniref:Tetratricopeptide repeat protein n=1 Tax=Engelhardtia mirabilis TaxID=2528011 RepID=A0A518BF40_9BACT|nr:Tetratricopeptide repeat protein [Planctomycetes bacterium Pla133]QDU99920.1 Tetratricopeptide repeat protein [Planctomycetes bacterium Pla86]